MKNFVTASGSASGPQSLITYLKTRPGLKKTGLKAGMTMLDILGVLLVGGLLIAGVIALIRTAIDRTRVQNAERALTTMAVQIKGHFAGAQDYTGLTNALAIKAGIIPTEVLKTSGVKTPWGGPITVAGGNDGTFTMSWGGLTDQICTNLATYQVDLWQGITINGNEVSSQQAIMDADTYCTGNNNTVVFIDR